MGEDGGLAGRDDIGYGRVGGDDGGAGGNDDRTKCPASWMEFDSSFYSSYKVQTGSAPTEVETEGVTCSGSARSQLAWAHTT